MIPLKEWIDRNQFKQAVADIHTLWVDLARAGTPQPYDEIMVRCQEEIGELSVAADESNIDQIVDGIGDVLVTFYQLSLVTPVKHSFDAEYEFAQHLMMVSGTVYVNDKMQEFGGVVDRCGVLLESTNHPLAVALFLAIEYVFSGINNNRMSIEQAIAEVNRSNMTKFPDVGSVDPDAECTAIEKKYAGRYSGISWKEVNGKYVFTEKSGKVVKPSTFQEPVLY